MIARGGPWREHAAPGLPALPWRVQHEDGRTARTDKGRERRFRRRAHAYAFAERLNRQERDSQSEVLKELGL